MKKTVLVFLTVVLPLQAWADAVEIDGIYYNLIDKGGIAEVTKGANKYVGDIVIPSMVSMDNKTYDVTGVSSNAFAFCYSLSSVTFPNSITSIGESVFMDCGSLTAVTLPDGITSIPAGMFYGCSNLATISVPEGVVSIGVGAFNGCYSLTSIVIPTNVEYIGNAAFKGCRNLTSVVLPERITTVFTETFAYCENLVSVVIPANVKYVFNKAFAGCKKLKEVYCYAENVPTADANIFDGSYVEYATLYVPEGSIDAYKVAEVWKNFGGIEANVDYQVGDVFTATTIEGIEMKFKVTDAEQKLCEVTEYAIPQETQGTVTIPESAKGYKVVRIEDTAFFNYSQISSVFIPESVTTIGEAAFSRCSNLTSVNIPSLVTKIGQFAFCLCSSLTSIVIPEFVTSIEQSTFYECGSLSSVTILGPLKTIGETAFTCCYALSAISLPNTVRSIGVYAFGGCNNLKEVTMDGVIFINREAFAGCEALTSISLPYCINFIDSGAFWNCKSLHDVYCYADQVPFTSQDESLFIQTDISNATLHVPAASVDLYKAAEVWKDFGTIVAIEHEWVDGETFTATVNGVEMLFTVISAANKTCQVGNDIAPEDGRKAIDQSYSGSLVIPEEVNGFSVVKIGVSAFESCHGLTAVSIPESVTEISALAFFDCTSIEEIYVSKNVKYLERRAFRNCPALKKITVDAENPIFDSRDNCNAIIYTAKNQLVNGCQNTIIPESIESINSYAFFNTYGLESITIPEKVQSIGEAAFYGCKNLSVVTSFMPTPIGIKNDTFRGIADNATLKVPAASVNLYKAAEVWKDFGSIVAIENESSSVNGVHTTNANETKMRIYSLDGKLLIETRRGVNIINGKKVIVK